MAWTAKVVDVDGTVIATLSDAARIGRIAFELNGPGAADITLPTTHADAAHLQPGREVQLLQDGTIRWWGPIVRPQAGLKESTWQCAGLPWYFAHRYMGRADRVNLIVNGDFEAGEASWTFEGGVTHSLDTAIKVEGTQSLELAGATANHQQYAKQTYTHAVQWHPVGDALTVSAWVYVPSVGYLGGAIEDFGLVARRRAADGTILDAQYAEIGDDTTKDEWLNLEVLIPGVRENDTLDVLLFPPHGTAYYDLVTVTLMESLAYINKDVADIIDGIVKYAQDLPSTYYASFGHGKSDLNIDVSAPATGTTATRVYMFAEHRQILDAIEEFVRQGVCDIDFVHTATTRTLTTYAPRKGSLYGTTLELDVNVADFTYSWDGERAASTVVMLGPGDGPDRPEGGATDPAFLGGLTLEIVETAPDDATVGELDARAAERLDVAKNPQILEVITLPGAGIIGALQTGDTVPVLISYGWVVIDATYRVVRIEVEPYLDQATLTLNIEAA